MNKPTLSEVRDQSLHMLYGACLMAAFIWPIPAWIAPLLVMIVAVERELEQHQWQEVGKLDLAFWFLSCLIFDAVYYSIKFI
jgi:hypothetical protein